MNDQYVSRGPASFEDVILALQLNRRSREQGPDLQQVRRERLSGELAETSAGKPDLTEWNAWLLANEQKYTIQQMARHIEGRTGLYCDGRSVHAHLIKLHKSQLMGGQG